jgi:hypothetical protein
MASVHLRHLRATIPSPNHIALSPVITMQGDEQLAGKAPINPP